MANQMFTELPQVVTAQLTDIICAVQGFVDLSNLGTSVQMTLAQVVALTSNTIILNNPGNPNGVVAGTAFRLLWDTTDELLWVCTQGGSAVTAVWVTCIGDLNDGEILIGSTLGVPQPATLTAGANVSIANGSNSIIIASTGSPGIGWTDVVGVSQVMVADNGYKANNAGLVTLTLPATAAFGSVLYIQGFGSGGWLIDQGAGQSIIIGNAQSTVGVAGSVASTHQNDSLQLLCVDTDLTWSAFGAPQSAGLTIL